MCELCLKRGHPCGPKQLPEDDKSSRDAIAKKAKFQKDLLWFADARLQRGETMESILNLIKLDDSLAPLAPNLTTEWPPNTTPNTYSHTFANQMQGGESFQNSSHYPQPNYNFTGSESYMTQYPGGQSGSANVYQDPYTGTNSFAQTQLYNPTNSVAIQNTSQFTPYGQVPHSLDINAYPTYSHDGGSTQYPNNSSSNFMY